MFTSVATAADALTHGWTGLMLDYVTVAGPMLATLAKQRARLPKLLGAPLLAVPVTLLAGVTTGVAQPLLHGLGMVSGGLSQLAAGAAISVAAGYVSGRLLARSVAAKPSYLRGALVDNVEAVAPAVPAGVASGRGRDGAESVDCKSAGRLTLAGLPIDPTDEVKHFKLIGTTGTGKSTAICEMLRGAFARGDRAVIADPDGGYLKRFYDERRGDSILNPFDTRASKWDLYAEITNDYDIDQLARSLIPDQDGSERSWRGYARTFFSAVVRQTHDAGVRDVRELYHLLVTANVKELKVLVEGTPAQPFLDEHNSRMFDSIRSVTSSAVGALHYIGQQEGVPLAVRNWIGTGKGVLFIPYQAGQIAALRSTISAWMRLAIFETMHRDASDQRLWFVVDELDALGQIDGLKDALARLRKFGGRCVLGFQSIAQVSGVYGRAEAQTIVENCGNTLVLRCSAGERGGTSGFASQLIGQREVLRTTQSRSRHPLRLLPTITRSESLSIEPAVLDSEIEQLADLRGYLKFASSPQWRRVALAPLEAILDEGSATNTRGAARKAWEAFRAKEQGSNRDITEHEQSRGLDGFGP